MLPVSEPLRPRRVIDPAADAARRFDRLALALLVVAALAWRAAWAATLPCISRDGVAFCNYARGLGERGIEFLRAPEAQQHPLYPGLILAAHRVLGWGGMAESPLRWQNAGQLVSFLAHGGVLCLTAWLARRWASSAWVSEARQMGAARAAPLIAVVLAALLPMHAWLGAEAMSDELHLFFYLSAIATLCLLPDWRWSLAAGALGGLAFLTRPEGAALPFVAAVGLWRLRAGTASRLRAMALVLAGFVACALPYWQIVGKFSSKKNPLATEVLLAVAEDAAGVANGVAAGEGVATAKLERVNHTWYALLPEVMHQLLRCGRIVIPLFGFIGLTLLAREAAAGRTLIVAGVLGHLTLCGWLLHRHDYLDQRHLLPVVALLTPSAAIAVSVVRTRSRGLWAVILGLVCFPLGWYSLHRPNLADRIWPLVASRLAALDPELRGKALVAGSSGKRLAFYCDARWVPWWEYPEDYPDVTRTLESAAGGYFAIELADGFETRGNRELLSRLQADPVWSGRLVQVLAMSEGRGKDAREVRVMRIERTP